MPALSLSGPDLGDLFGGRQDVGVAVAAVRQRQRRLEIQSIMDAAQPLEAWFEQAVDACAFLVWRVCERGARVRFRTQAFDLSIPEMGDVYAILKYLATVAPAPAKPLSEPEDENSYQIVFTDRHPDAVVEAGWSQARIVGPDVFPRRAALPDAAG